MLILNKDDLKVACLSGHPVQCTWMDRYICISIYLYIYMYFYSNDMSYKDHEKVGLVERNKNFLWIVLKVLKLDHNPVPALASSYPTIFTTKTCFLPTTNGSLFLSASARGKKLIKVSLYRWLGLGMFLENGRSSNKTPSELF